MSQEWKTGPVGNEQRAVCDATGQAWAIADDETTASLIVRALIELKKRSHGVGQEGVAGSETGLPLVRVTLIGGGFGGIFTSPVTITTVPGDGVSYRAPEYGLIVKVDWA